MIWRYCPHCGEQLPSPGPPVPAPSGSTKRPAPDGAQDLYDQTKHWSALLKEADSIASPPPTDAIVERLLSVQSPVPVGLPLSSIVHLVLDREVTPSGGVLLQSVMSEGRQGPAGDLDRLRRLGYVIEDGKVKQVEGVPVGRAFMALQYWGGERHHRRWHLLQAVYVNPSRKDDPFFMDDRLVAFGAVWRDLDHFADAMTALVEILRNGFDGAPIANPLVVDVFWRGTPPSRE
jgi:hypothetical protein